MKKIKITKAKVCDFDVFMQFMQTHYKEVEKHALENLREDAEINGLSDQYYIWKGEMEDYEIDNGKFDHPKMFLQGYTGCFGSYGMGSSHYATFYYYLKGS